MAKFRIRTAEPDQQLVAIDGKLVLKIVDEPMEVSGRVMITKTNLVKKGSLHKGIVEFFGKKQSGPIKAEKSTAFEGFLKRNAKSRLFRQRVKAEAADV